MQALISPNEQVYNNYVDPPIYLGQRIAQVEPDENIFEITPPLYWLSCEDFITACDYYYDANTKLFMKKPTENASVESQLINADEVIY